MKELIYNHLKETGYIKEADGNVAYNEIELQENKNVVLKGNKLGLILLADYLIEIALSDRELTHVHLDADNFFDRSNVELIIGKSNK